MQRSASLTVSLLTSATLFSVGCGSDLGDCDDPAQGRTLVENGGRLSYAGQAIMSQACAQGCHSEGAAGKLRVGAPADLNFDLQPLAPGVPIMNAQNQVIGVQVDETARAKLRRHQQTVYDNREAIWEQVQKGLMPPREYSVFKTLRGMLTRFMGQYSCTSTGALTNLDQDKALLRKWLACGTPVVETSSPDLPYLPPVVELDQAAGAASYSGTVGYQYPSCSAPMPDGGSPDGGGVPAPSFAELYRDIFDAQCSICHYTGSAINDTLDLGTEDIAYTELLGANGMGGATACTAMNPNPFVTPGKPEESYLLTKVGAQPGTICGQIMVAPPGIAKQDADKIRAWIMAGAPR